MARACVRRVALLAVACAIAASGYSSFGRAYTSPTPPPRLRAVAAGRSGASGLTGVRGEATSARRLGVPSEDSNFGRWGAAALVALCVVVVGFQEPARAEQAWQLKLPQAWKVFSQTPQPPAGQNTPAALVVAGDEAGAGELVVLRVPLVVDGTTDPDAGNKQKLVNYFANDPKTSRKDAVDALVATQKQQNGLTRFDLNEKSDEKVKGAGRYIRYDYDSSTCTGAIVNGAGGKMLCQKENGDALNVLNRHHGVTMTVVQEVDAKVPVLWVLDLSAPSESWESFQKVAKDLGDSFDVASEAQLEKDRSGYVEKLNDQAKQAQANAQKYEAEAALKKKA